MTGIIILDYPDGFTIVTRVLVSDRGKWESQKSRCENGGSGWRDASAALKMEERGHELGHGKSKETDSPAEPLETSPTDTLSLAL